MEIYYIGLAKREKTLVIQAVRNVDFLSCEIYDYYGKHQITKRKLRKNRYKILSLMKKKRPEVYKDLKYAIVE